MLGPCKKPLDASIKSVAIVVSYDRAGEVCITLLNRSFVSFIDRKQTRHSSVPEHGYAFNPCACYAGCTDAGMRNWFELCFYPASWAGTDGRSSHCHAAVVVQVMISATLSDPVISAEE
jgi:hypothetical protein